MATELELFTNLYSEDDKEVFDALVEKRNWLFDNVRYVKGSDIPVKDAQGRDHFMWIEALLDDTLYFEKLSIPEEHMEDDEYRQYLESSLNESFAFLTLYDDIDDSAPFWIEYDFSYIDKEGYNALVANFFHKKSLDYWQVDYDKLRHDLFEQMKFAIAGEENESVIIMEHHNLINGHMFAPVAKKIYALKDADPLLKEELESIAKEKHLEYKEVSLDE
ncbi:MAG: hypothetical protein HUJ61_07955 [Bacilli bacterium]|nr:hypothetical protein [Bacilli bacterium]